MAPCAKRCIPAGAFSSIDMIGRNGTCAGRSAGAGERIWRFLPDDKKYHHLLKRIDCLSRTGML